MIPVPVANLLVDLAAPAIAVGGTTFVATVSVWCLKFIRRSVLGNFTRR